MPQQLPMTHCTAQYSANNGTDITNNGNAGSAESVDTAETENGPSNNNRLASLTVKGVELSPAFDPEEKKYTATVPFETEKLEVEAVPADEKATVTISDTESPYTEGINGISYGNNEVGVGPYIKVADDSAKALGYLNGGSDVGLAVKDMGIWTSVYSSAPNIPNRLIRNILKESGGHIYSTNSDDIVFANNHYVTIHSAFAGKRTISLPEKVSVYDVYADKFVSMNTDKIEIELKDGETRMYRLMSPNKYSVLVHSNSGGSISPFGITEVSPGAALDITVKADSGYYVEKLLINGETADVQKENIHLSDIRGNVTVEAVFAKLKTAKPPVEEEIPPPEEEGSTDITYENVVRGDEPEQEQTEESSGKVKKYKKVIVTYPEGLPVWAIVLIAAGGVLLAGGGVFFVILLRRKKKKTQQ